MRRRTSLLVGVGALVVVAGLAFWFVRSRHGAVRYAVTPVDRGDIADVVGATGVLQAVTTVQVGSQVSGTIQSLFADFNSVVKKGQVIAKLDPSLFEAKVAQAQANAVSAQANVEKSKAAVDDAKQKYDRAKELAAEQLLPQTDLDSAKAAYDGALAQDRSDTAAVKQSEASVNQAKLDLEHTVIQAPIDGVVLARSVDVGQTVAASLQAPVLFAIANDLTQMEVNASIDEADVGRVKPAQSVSFRVDAFPDDTFWGSVKQVRLQPITNQNVVTYNTIISVENRKQQLMPGMTATVSVIVDNRKGVLRVPATALRFRPEGFEERPARSRTGGAASTASPAPSAEGSAAPAASGAASPAGSNAPGKGSGRARKNAADAGTGDDGQLRSGLVFVLDENEQPKPVRVHLGLSDGQHTEIVDGLNEGDRVITGLDNGAGGSRPAGRAGASPAATNPFAPQRAQPRTR